LGCPNRFSAEAFRVPQAPAATPEMNSAAQIVNLAACRNVELMEASG
jgi:hypothetical protein